MGGPGIQPRPQAPSPEVGPSEASLVRSARTGDAEAFEQLAAPVLPMAFQLAVRLIGDREDAADIVQDALLSAYVGLGRFSGRSSFRTWLLRIVHNAAMDVLRYRARHPQVPLASREDAPGAPVTDPPDSAPGPEEKAVARWQRAQIVQALQRLYPTFRVVVVLRDVHGLSYEEIGGITGVPVGTVKSRLHRGRAMLRADLEDGAREPFGAGGVGYTDGRRLHPGTPTR